MAAVSGRHFRAWNVCSKTEKGSAELFLLFALVVLFL